VTDAHTTAIRIVHELTKIKLLRTLDAEPVGHGKCDPAPPEDDGRTSLGCTTVML